MVVSLIDAFPGHPATAVTPNQQIRRSKKMIKRFLRDETGLELSEYAVAAALVALAAVAAFQLLGTNIGVKINELAGKIQ
jgi:pilus assembly protein Flp/PilA